MTTTNTPPGAVPAHADLVGRPGAPDGSSWHVFTTTPERGTANFATAAHVRAAAAGVTEGTVFSLDYALDAFDPPMSRARRVPSHEILAAHPEARDDLLHEFFLQSTTQLDGLRHRRASGHGFYGGAPDAEITVGSPTLGVQRWAEHPIVGRGVLIDVQRWTHAAGRPLEHRAGPALPMSVLDDALDAQGIELIVGDLVLVHTGWAHWYLTADPAVRAEVGENRRATGFAQSRELPAWLWDHRVALFATDTFAVEVLPVLPDSPFLQSAPEDRGMMHQELIAKLGVPLGELWNLHDLASHSHRSGRWDALVTVKPLHLTGGVGSPANATAIR